MRITAELSWGQKLWRPTLTQWSQVFCGHSREVMGYNRIMGVSFQYKASGLTERVSDVHTEEGVWVRSRKELILEFWGWSCLSASLSLICLIRAHLCPFEAALIPHTHNHTHRHYISLRQTSNRICICWKQGCRQEKEGVRKRAKAAHLCFVSHPR